ncbi:helix-turn-helix domain-containing protein [bacterium]|nr:helix-turn-helix domain-containing protein [bacterium]
MEKEIKLFKLYTVPEVAELLSLNPQTVKLFIREGRIKAKRVGRRYLILGRNILEYLKS